MNWAWLQQKRGLLVLKGRAGPKEQKEKKAGVALGRDLRHNNSEIGSGSGGLLVVALLPCALHLLRFRHGRCDGNIVGVHFLHGFDLGEPLKLAMPVH